jgi:fatty acid-binding protein DegV
LFVERDDTPVVVVTDSTGVLPGVSHPCLHVVPVVLLFADGEVLDGEVAAADVYRRLADGDVVKSQAPAPAAFLSAIEEGDHAGAVVLTPAQEFTVMLHNARQASELAVRPHVVLDTRTAAAGQALVVRAALDAAHQGAPLPQVVRAARDAIDRVELVAAMLDVHHLEHSGRVDREVLERRSARAGALVARFLHGQVVPVVVSGDPLRALASTWRSSGGRPEDAVVFHGAQPERAVQLAELVGGCDVVACSPAMGVHVGPDLVGLAWLRNS